MEKSASREAGFSPIDFCKFSARLAIIEAAPLSITSGAKPLAKPSAKEEVKIEALQLILELMCRGIQLLPVDARKSKATAYSVEDGNIRLPLNVVPGCGENAAIKLKEAIESDDDPSIDEIQQNSGVNGSVIDKLKEMGVFAGFHQSAQFSLFDL